jgi:hypothetical protein
MRNSNSRMRVLSLALLASVACVAPPFAGAGLAQTPAAQLDLSTVITRDVATGLGAVFLRDLKVVTVIFPDVAFGDTLVLTTRKTIHSDTFAGHFEMMISLPRNISRADSTVMVTAPSSLPLKIAP